MEGSGSCCTGFHVFKVSCVYCSGMGYLLALLWNLGLELLIATSCRVGSAFHCEQPCHKEGFIRAPYGFGNSPAGRLGGSKPRVMFNVGFDSFINILTVCIYVPCVRGSCVWCLAAHMWNAGLESLNSMRKFDVFWYAMTKISAGWPGASVQPAFFSPLIWKSLVKSIPALQPEPSQPS